MRNALHATFVLLTALAACAPTQQGVRDAPPPGESSLRRLEGRLVGLTDELDRLSRRVSALEGGETAAPAARPTLTTSPASRPSPEPPPGWLQPAAGPEFPESAGPATGPAGWTGVVIDARRAQTTRGPAPTTENAKRWRVLDYQGKSILASSGVSERLLRTRPFFFRLEEGATLGAAESALVGERPLEGTADFAEIYVHEDDSEEALFYVDDSTARALRTAPGMADLVGAGNVVVLLPKQP